MLSELQLGVLLLLGEDGSLSLDLQLLRGRLGLDDVGGLSGLLLLAQLFVRGGSFLLVGVVRLQRLGRLVYICLGRLVGGDDGRLDPGGLAGIEQFLLLRVDGFQYGGGLFFDILPIGLVLDYISLGGLLVEKRGELFLYIGDLLL